MTRSPDEWDARRALDAAVLHAIPRVAPIGAALYALAILTGLVGLSPEPLPLGISFGAGIVGALLVWVAARHPRFPPRAANALACVLVAQALENTAAAFYYTPNVTSIVGFVVITLAAPLLFLSVGWVLGTIVGAWLAMGTVLLLVPGQVPFATAMLSMVCAGAISVIMVLVRIETNLRFERIRHDDEIQKQALAESRQRYRSLFEGVPVGLVRLDEDGHFLDGNGAAIRLLGYPDRATFLRGNVLDMQIDPLARARFRHALRHDERLQGLEVHGRSFDGRELWLRFSARVGDDPQGARTYESVFEDVTAQKAAARELEESRRLVARSERLASLGTVVGGVAHEINNPLTYMRGYTELVQATLREVASHPGLGPEERAAMHESADMSASVLRGIARVAYITTSLEAVARPTSGERTSVAPDALVNDVLAQVATRVRGDVRIVTELHATRAVRADREALTQALLHLVANAADALAEAERGIVTVTTRDEDGALHVAVADDGPGIAADDHPKIFTPFHTTRADGLGLGLATAHRIVEDHGGTITFESAPGRGTVFHLRVPHAGASMREVGFEPTNHSWTRS